MPWCAPKTQTSWWWTPTAATGSRSRRAATWRCAISRGSWWATSCSRSRLRREDLPRLYDRVPRRRAILPERWADTALVGADARSRGPSAGRPLSHNEETGRGRHGSGVPRRAREDGAAECHQGDEPCHGARSRSGGPLQSRGVECQPHLGRSRLRHLRLRRDARRAHLPGDGVHRGRAAHGADQARGSAAPCPGRRHRYPSGGRAPGRPRPRHRAPRPEARQYHARAQSRRGGRGEGRRFRPCQGRGRRGVRPDLHFPPGLQQVLDTALARSPVDRYQSAAKLAHDLAAVAGLSRAAGGAARPATLTDGDDKTELIEPERARRRSRVPIVVAVIVVLGAAGAVVTIGRPLKQTVGVPPADTAQQIAPSPPSVDTATRAAVVPPRRGPVERSRAPATPRRIDVTRARDVLDDLLLNKLDPRSAAMVLDSAMHIFNAPGIASSDKAYAAFVVGNAYFQQFNRRRGCDWVRTATVLSPTDTTYPKILARC